MENKGLNKRTGEIHPLYHLMCTDVRGGKKEDLHNQCAEELVSVTGQMMIQKIL